MIQKFIRIQNIGKFRNCKAVGDVVLRKLSLIYAENGRGKTTLCDILRSLSTGNGDLVKGRKMLGSSQPASIEIRLDNSNANFDGEHWSTTMPELYIFDNRFIDENVYSGEVVEHGHKRNLFRVIVGEKGVSLAQKVDSLDAQVREADRLMKASEVNVSKFVPPKMSADDYVALQADPDIDDKIITKDAELVALRRSEEIAKKALLKQIEIPTLPSMLRTVLEKKLDDISTTTEQVVREHIRNHTNGATEPWLAQGIKFEKDNVCPLCGIGIDGNDLIAAYRAYFGETYKVLKDEVATLRGNVSSFGNGQAQLITQQILSSNIDLTEFWKQFINFEVPNIDEDEYFSAINELKAYAISAVDRKAAAILEPVTLNADFEKSSARFDTVVASAEAYNAGVSAVNTLISSKKSETDAGNLGQVEIDLKLLNARKERHNIETSNVCQTYIDAQHNKRLLETKKDEAKQELNDHTKDILGVFQDRINRLLEMVTAGFRLDKVSREYKGRSPRSTYQVLINDTHVELGDGNTLTSEPSFRNTLSAGDRSTLALAFFLAKIELDSELEQKVIVFDDPFTSQDLSRRTWTQQRICKIANKAKQVIVLSHEPNFLSLIHDAMQSASVKTLQFCRIGKEDTTITPWDITDTTRGDYSNNHGVLTEFLNEGEGSIDLRHIAQTIRLVLEAYFRFKFPGEFGKHEWLGDFIDKIRSAPDNSSLSLPKMLLEELEDINDYSKKYHHNTNPGADTMPINDGELRSFVKRTLEVVGGY